MKPASIGTELKEVDGTKQNSDEWAELNDPRGQSKSSKTADEWIFGAGTQTRRLMSIEWMAESPWRFNAPRPHQKQFLA